MGIHSHRKSEKRKIDMKLFIFLQLNALTYAWTVLPPGGDVYDYGFDYSTSDLVESSKRTEEFLERLEETFDFIDKTVWTRSHYFWEFFFGEKSDCVFNCTIEVDRKVVWTDGLLDQRVKVERFKSSSFSRLTNNHLALLRCSISPGITIKKDSMSKTRPCSSNIPI